ncbi:hypothetical protein [Hymenobacter edaphi]|uniref:Uncharacterized protein n=1 Tax=Hymenobacter edaphi TaxID=2211146 RepID=A0A328BUS5_9BACT|nr:hypothetical protein [Hymenobacter edaphi]RAK69634.1 hypothetical protein DLM85_01880 [Hymenobacter edaphi]
MRVLTDSGLVLKQLRWDEWLIVGLYAVLVAWPEWLLSLMLRRQLHYSAKEVLSLSFVGFIVGLLMIAFAPGTRFRNVYFSLGWLGLSSWLAVRSHGVALEPLVLFLLYQAVRWHFWNRYQRELVPASVSRAGYEHDYYRLEKRYGSSEDIGYTKFLFRTGMVLLFLLSWMGIRLVS